MPWMAASPCSTKHPGRCTLQRASKREQFHVSQQSVCSQQHRVWPYPPFSFWRVVNQPSVNHAINHPTLCRAPTVFVFEFVFVLMSCVCDSETERSLDITVMESNHDLSTVCTLCA
jgi:hypothetical protein